MGCGVAKIAQRREEELQREKEKFTLTPKTFPESLAASFKAQRQQQRIRSDFSREAVFKVYDKVLGKYLV